MEKTRTPEDAARFWSDLEEEVVAWRRHFHQHPELSFQEFETAKYVENVLRAVGIEEVEAPTPTSRVAVIRGELPAGAGAFKTVAVRADMDALPVAEHEGGRKLPFCSVNPGVSHACGHDSHIAMLLGAAKALWRDRASFAGRVKLIFQHAEETAKSGAEELVALGVMDGVDACVGLHVMNQPMGTIAICRSRAATTAADSVWVDLEGCGTHASMPEGGVDPVMVGAEIISALHTIVSRTIAPSRFAVVSPTVFQAGGVVNVIPQTARLGINIRTKEPEDRIKIRQRTTALVEGIAAAHGAKAALEWLSGCPAVLQDERIIEAAFEAARAVLPPEKVLVGSSMSASDDFAFFAEKAPSVYVMLGGGTKEEGYPYQNHHPAFAFDERCLIVGTRFEVAMAKRLLAEPQH